MEEDLPTYKGLLNYLSPKQPAGRTTFAPSSSKSTLTAPRPYNPKPFEVKGVRGYLEDHGT